MDPELVIQNLLSIAPQIQILQLLLITEPSDLPDILPLFRQLRHFAINNTSNLAIQLGSINSKLDSVQLVAKEEEEEDRMNPFEQFEEILVDSKAKCLAKLSKIYVSGVDRYDVLERWYGINEADNEDTLKKEGEKPYSIKVQDIEVNVIWLGESSFSNNWRLDLKSVEEIGVSNLLEFLLANVLGVKC